MLPPIVFIKSELGFTYNFVLSARNIYQNAISTQLRSSDILLILGYIMLKFFKYILLGSAKGSSFI